MGELSVLVDVVIAVGLGFSIAHMVIEGRKKRLEDLSRTQRGFWMILKEARDK